MNLGAYKGWLLRSRRELERAMDDPAFHRYVLRWILPALFALLVSITIRFHSLTPMATMPHVVASLLTLAAIAFLFLLVRGTRLTLPPDVALLWVALAVAVAISVLGSGNAKVSLVRAELYLSVFMLAAVVYVVYRHHEQLPLEAYFLGVAIVHVPFLFEAVRWISDMEPPFWEFSLRLADFENVRQFGEFGFLAAVSASAVGLLDRRFVIPAFLLAVAAVFGIALSGSRGALLCWALFIVLMSTASRARLLAASHGLLVLILGAGSVWYLDHTGLLPSPNVFRRIEGALLGTETFDSGRLQVWWASLQQIAARPLFGSGPEGFFLSGCCSRYVLQAHNFVLQFLLEFGLVGCGIAALLVRRAVNGLGGVSRTIELILGSKRNTILVCGLAAFLAYSLIDQMMYHVLPLLHFGLFAGLFAAGLVQERTVRRIRNSGLD